MRRAPGVALGALLLAGCGQMAIDGEVVTVSGEPAVGARVTAMGSNCTTTVGEDGRFALPCMPGTYQLVITQEGFIEVKEDLEALERKRYDVGKKVMIAIPSEKGLFWFKDNQYVPLQPGYLTRTISTVDGSKARAYCLDRSQGQANTLAAGTHAFFDNQTDGWRPFRLDEQGCAYRDRKEGGRWEVLYKEKPPYEERTMEQGKKIALIELAAGDYYIADWDNGFFTTDDADNKRYTGFWLSVP